MEIIYKKGNLLDAQTDVIAHQVNCQGVMGSGVAKQIKEKWPDVFAQYSYHTTMHEKVCLGNCQLVQINKSQFVANLFGQRYYGRENLRYTSYDGIYDACYDVIRMLEHACRFVLILGIFQCIKYYSAVFHE